RSVLRTDKLIHQVAVHVMRAIEQVHGKAAVSGKLRLEFRGCGRAESSSLAGTKRFGDDTYPLFSQASRQHVCIMPCHNCLARVDADAILKEDADVWRQP